MTIKVIVDTGPLVAFLNGKDQHHKWALSAFGRFSPPFFSCESVLSEATFLLRAFPPAVEGLLSMLDRRLVVIDFSLAENAGRVGQLMKKYASVPMSLADGCLVRMSELQTSSEIMTLDSDFKIYRRNGRQSIPTIGP